MEQYGTARQAADDVEQYGTARQATDDKIIRRLRIARTINKATDAHSEYVMLTGLQDINS